MNKVGKSRTIGSFALYSRLLVILMQALFNYLMPDHNADAFKPPSSPSVTVWDDLVHLLFEGFRRWDGIYFIHIAEHGYTYENTLAFFPLFPILTSLVANSVLFPLQYIMNYQNVLLVSATVLNVFVFVQSAKLLYKLGVIVLGSETLALKAAQLYCINPASIFFSAAYSESTFAMLSFWGMIYVEEDKLFKASILFGLSSATRSNGIPNAGFLLFKTFRKFCKRIDSLQKSQSNDPKYIISSLISITSSVLWSSVFYLTVCVLPFIAFQFYGHEQYCHPFSSSASLPSHVVSYGNEQSYRMPHSGVPVWCHRILPFSYFHIQGEHWGNGFLKYYEFKQIPNFLLATPMLALCVFGAAMYIGRNTHYCVTLGLSDPRDSKHKKSDVFIEQCEVSEIEVGFFNKRCYIYTMHMLCLSMIGILFMHVQVITRLMASSCPVLYWFISHSGTSEDQLASLRSASSADIGAGHASSADNRAGHSSSEQLEQNNDWEYHGLVKLIFIYFHLYLFVGVAAFSNFLPWT